MKPEDCILFSGAAQGAEAAFGETAERYGIDEVNFTFEGHSRRPHARHPRADPRGAASTAT